MTDTLLARKQMAKQVLLTKTQGLGQKCDMVLNNRTTGEHWEMAGA